MIMTDDNESHDYYADAPVDIQFPNAPTEREACFFDADEEDTLFDAYQMLRYAGVPMEELWPMVMTIELTTTYDRNDLERYYREVVADDETDDA